MMLIVPETPRQMAWLGLVIVVLATVVWIGKSWGQLAPLPPLPGLDPLPPLQQPRTYTDTHGGTVTVQPQPGGGATGIDGRGRMTIITPDGMIIRPPR